MFSFLLAGICTEVDTFSVPDAGPVWMCGVAVPAHEFVVNMVHAMEGREQ